MIGRVGAVRNYRTYYLSNLSPAGKPVGNWKQIKWEREYDFREAYQQAALDISAIVPIARSLKTNAFIQKALRAILFGERPAWV